MTWRLCSSSQRRLNSLAGPPVVPARFRSGRHRPAKGAGAPANRAAVRLKVIFRNQRRKAPRPKSWPKWGSSLTRMVSVSSTAQPTASNATQKNIQTTSAAADSFIGLRGQVTTLFSVGPAAIAGRGSAFLWEADEQTDGQLLAKFVRYRDTEALEVRRHTPMVWGVCRRSADAQGWSGSFAWRCPRNQQGTEPPQAG